MRIHLANDQSMYRLQMQNPLQRTMGQVQNSGLEKIVQQVNAKYGGKQSRDIVELSQKALELLDASKTKKAEEAKKPEAASGYQKYAPGLYTKEGWAEQAVLAQRDGIQTVSDVVDYAKSNWNIPCRKVPSWKTI